MWKATIRGLLARRVRLALSALAVMLGVSFVAGTYVLTDTLDRSFNNVFDQTVSGVDLVVQVRQPFGGETERDRFPDAIVGRVAAVPGVATATGFLEDYAQIVDKNGDAIQTAGAPTFGIAWGQQGRDGPLRPIADGTTPSRPPRGPGEVAIDVGTARASDLHVGDHVRILLKGPAREFTIVGLFGFGSRVDAGGVTFAAFDVPTAQALFDAPGDVDAVNVTAANGGSVRALRTRIGTELGPAYEVDLARDVAHDRGKRVLTFLDLLTELLLGFAAIGLVVAAFIIFNTFTILVAQRTRELGLLRAMGASGGQVVTSVVVEAGMIGVLASIAGVALGFGLAAALFAVVGAAGFDVPDGPLVLSTRTIVAAMSVGVVVTLVSSIWPAVRAARISPIAAIADPAQAPERPLRLRAIIGGLAVAIGIPLLIVGLDRTRDAPNITSDIWLVALGALAVFFGVVILLATFARPLASVLGWPLRALGVTGVLARANATRNPRRTAATASALVIGLGVVGVVAIFGASAKASVRASVDRGIRADFVLKAQQFAGFSPQVAERLRSLPTLDAVAAMRFGNVRVNGNEETVAGIDVAQLRRVVDLRATPGSIAAMSDDGIMVYVDAAREYGVKPGDTVQVQFPRGFTVLRVVGTYQQEDFTGALPVPFVISKTAFDNGFGVGEQDSLIYVSAKGNADAAQQAIERALHHDFPNIQIFTRQEFRDDQERAIDRFLTVTYALLLLSELIAILGIVNTLALSVFERFRELGLLRAVGMSREQVRRMVRAESLVIALLGGIVGSAVGVFWGWAFTTALRSQGVTELEIPVGQLVAFLVLSMLAGVAAALLPAWRASRLDVLDAIAVD
jgi:putative ABC transport system permease protein